MKAAAPSSSLGPPLFETGTPGPQGPKAERARRGPRNSGLRAYLNTNGPSSSLGRTL